MLTPVHHCAWLRISSADATVRVDSGPVASKAPDFGGVKLGARSLKPGAWSQRPASVAASVEALSARLAANTRFLTLSASLAWLTKRLAVSYCVRPSVLSAR
jgi:hypothetical protein